MKKILILNGPNLNLQGKRDVEIYGTTTFEEYTATLAERYEGRAEFDYFQSNIEGELIENGAGVVLRKKLDRLSELFIFKRNKQTPAPVVRENNKNQ